MLSAIVGINWGDEGKGRMVDLFSSEYDIICRYQGGNNAGHTVINEKGKFILNLLPSGVLCEQVVNVLGPGMVIDIEHLYKELADLNNKGVCLTPKNLKISDKAFLCMPYHVRQDILEEERLGDKKYGSTRRGIAPAYADKYAKKGLRIGDLTDAASLKDKLASILEWKNIAFKGRGEQQIRLEETYEWLCTFGSKIAPYIDDTTAFLHRAARTDKKILFEAQLGALRDIDYGIYPYTTSSQTLAAYAPIGAGIPGAKLDKVIGVIKAYSSCVGEGPFVAEMQGEEAQALRTAGFEFGAATGRPRRVGAFDVTASRYGVQTQGANELALTKLDVLSYMDAIPVCTAYEVDGKRVTSFPSGGKLSAAKPVYEYLPGFKSDVSKCRRMRDLPKAALAYIKFIENAMQCPVTYVSVGAERGDYIKV